MVRRMGATGLCLVIAALTIGEAARAAEDPKGDNTHAMAPPPLAESLPDIPTPDKTKKDAEVTFDKAKYKASEPYTWANSKDSKVVRWTSEDGKNVFVVATEGGKTSIYSAQKTSDPSVLTLGTVVNGSAAVAEYGSVKGNAKEGAIASDAMIPMVSTEWKQRAAGANPWVPSFPYAHKGEVSTSTVPPAPGALPVPKTDLGDKDGRLVGRNPLYEGYYFGTAKGANQYLAEIGGRIDGHYMVTPQDGSRAFVAGAVVGTGGSVIGNYYRYLGPDGRPTGDFFFVPGALGKAPPSPPI